MFPSHDVVLALLAAGPAQLAQDQPPQAIERQLPQRAAPNDSQAVLSGPQAHPRGHGPTSASNANKARSETATAIPVGTAAGQVVGIEAESGKELFHFEVGEEIRLQPALSGGRIFVGRSAGTPVSVDSDPALDGWTMGGGGPEHNGPRELPPHALERKSEPRPESEPKPEAAPRHTDGGTP